MIGQLERIIELQKLDEANKPDSAGNLITFTSGKGGVGKTVLSLNLAHALSVQGKKVLFTDLDLNYSNAHILLNMIPSKDMADYFEGKSLLKKIVTQVDNNFFLLPGGSGSIEIKGSFSNKIASLFTELKKLSYSYDYIFIDTGQMNDLKQIDIILNSDLVMIITSPEPTAVMDAYVVVKMLKQNNCNLNKYVIVNKCSDKDEADVTFNNLNNATEYFLSDKLVQFGYVNFDPSIHKSIISQKLLLNEFPESPVVEQLFKLSTSIAEIVQVANIKQ
jgi:flagellar biosynthesis protein FlhG